MARKEKIKLDEILNRLFDISKPLLVDMLNSLFGENFDSDSVEISKDNTKFVNEQLGVIQGDLFYRLVELESKPHHYHIELQTFADGGMGIRVLEYDIAKAVESARLERAAKDGRIVLRMPKSVVIHIESNTNIPNRYTIEIEFANGARQEYVVPVVKYWEHTEAELIAKKLYPLLPLQVFLLRSELDRVTKKRGNKAAKLTAIQEAKNAAERVAKESKGLYDTGKLSAEDLGRILEGITSLFTHLNERYKVAEELNEEVYEMIKTLYDPAMFDAGKREKAIEIAKNLIMMDLEFDIIKKATGFSIKEIEKIAAELKKQEQQ